MDRKKIVETAHLYAEFEWVPSINHVFHGRDSEGALINTPDISYIQGRFQCGWWQVNEKNKGMPYNWGGSSTIEQFRCGLWQGKYAGNVPDERSKSVSIHCVGLDCSGLVSICWQLPKKLSTRDLPLICRQLDSFDELQPGDILLIPGNHVMIFLETQKDKTYRIIDCTRSSGRTMERSVSQKEIEESGYLPYTKR